MILLFAIIALYFDWRNKYGFYYKFITKFILAYEDDTINTSQKARKELVDSITELRKQATNIANRNTPFIWFSAYGKGLHRLIKNDDFNKMGTIDKKRTLEILKGTLPRKDDFSSRSAHIAYKGLSIHFNPQSIANRISAASENKYVHFAIGFAYDGLRAYHDSIELMKDSTSIAAPVKIEKGAVVIVTFRERRGAYIRTTLLQDSSVRADLKEQNFIANGYSRADIPCDSSATFEVKLIEQLVDRQTNKHFWRAELIPKDRTRSGLSSKPFANIADLLKK